MLSNVSVPVLGAVDTAMVLSFGVTRTTAMQNAMLFSLAIHGVLLALLVPGFGTHGLWAAFTVFMIARTMTLGSYYQSLVKSV